MEACRYAGRSVLRLVWKLACHGSICESSGVAAVNRKEGEYWLVPRRSLWAFLIFLIAVLGATETASASNNKGFRGFGTCNATYRPDPDRLCYFGDGVGAALIAKKGTRVRYTLCVTRTATGAKDCFKRRTGRRGRPSSVRLFNKSIVGDIGTYRLKWRVRGKGIIARATLVMLLGD